VLDIDGESSQRLRHYGQPQVFGRSVEEPVDPIFIGSTRRSYLHPQIHIEIWMDQKIVPISLPQLAIIDLLKKFKKKYSSQENNNLRNKMIKRTYQEVLSTVVHKKEEDDLENKITKRKRFKDNS